LDIAKHVFQVHGADGAGHVLVRKRITRVKLLGFLAARTRCVVAMEACAGAHYWAREIAKLGHHVRLIAPAYVKPFIKRQKNDAADAEALPPDCLRDPPRGCRDQRALEDPTARRLMTIPGVGPIASTAITALVPAAEGFPAGRDFAAWLGLTPLQKSTGGKQALGAVSKRVERTIRRLLIIGASAVVQQASRRGAPKGSWLAQMLSRKPEMLVTVALANKMARIIWALLVKGGAYRTPIAAA
jgi:transposase